MIHWQASDAKLEYEVRVGHMRVIVQSGSRQDAIEQARRQLSRELPRMWDVIHDLDENRFEVTCRTN